MILHFKSFFLDPGSGCETLVVVWVVPPCLTEAVGELTPGIVTRDTSLMDGVVEHPVGQVP